MNRLRNLLIEEGLIKSAAKADDTMFISDFGHPLSATYENGTEQNIGRYGVWSGKGRRKPEVIDTGDDLQALQRKYGPGLRVVRL